MRLTLAPLVLLGGPLSLPWGQGFEIDNSVIPVDISRTSDVEFGDVDLDGDWDVVLAQGDEETKKQNRLWINQGGLQQAVIGTFSDETAVRMPQMTTPSLDIDLADIDGDGDLDMHGSDSSEISLSDGCRWLVNVGGDQGGTIGYFVDETAQRWIGLGQPGSSIPSTLLTVDGATFLDDCHDSDLADLDNDGDLDLVHTSKVGLVSAVHTPTRIFLNDGSGRFQEFNPSGQELPAGILTIGQPGVWCEGVYSPSTIDSSGSFFDVATNASDVEIGDIDGDFDLDILLGDDLDEPRAFANRLTGSSLAPSAGALAFRDVTALVLPIGLGASDMSSTELGDIDQDGDLDLAGSDWSVVGGQLNDTIQSNDGAGIFGVPNTLPGSMGADSEPDFLDYDGDGDLDVYIAAWSAGRLYRNDGPSGFVEESFPVWVGASLDADAADVDGDGDYDLLTGDASLGNNFLRNITQSPDQSAPRIPTVEQLAGGTASPGQLAVRAHVLDNAPLYISRFNETWVDVQVDGVSLPQILGLSSHGQIFRAEIPANLVGGVDYVVSSMDEHGNVGASASSSFTLTFPAFSSTFGAGTAGVQGGTVPSLQALSVPFSNSTLYLAGHSDAPPGTLALFGVSGSKLASPLLLPGLAVLNVDPAFLVFGATATDPSGDAVLAVDIPVVPAGIEVYVQLAVADPSVSGELFSVSQGLGITLQ